MGKYTDRVGARLERNQQVTTTRKLVRIVFIVFCLALMWWAYRRFVA